MRLRHALLLIAITTTGCDRISGVADQKIFDAEAIGYACRVSLKTPEDCMKENETHSPSSVLTGWKAADKDIVDKKLDPGMGANPVRVEQTEPASAALATDETKPVSGVVEAASEKAQDHPKASENKPSKSH